VYRYCGRALTPGITGMINCLLSRSLRVSDFVMYPSLGFAGGDGRGWADRREGTVVGRFVFLYCSLG